METTPQKHLRVVSLQTTNFKRIKAARVDPDPTEHVILIGGEIDNGKSSLLDSMMAVLGGKDASPEVPVRKGMKKGQVVLDLGELTATLRFTAAGGRELIVEDKDGNPQRSPQALMDKLTGKVGFDAEDFIRRKPDDQLAILRKIVGIDFAEIDAKKKTAYDLRTLANADVRTLETRLASAPNPTDAPAELVDTTAVLEEIQKAQEHNKGLDRLADLHRTTLANAKSYEQVLQQCRTDVANHEKAIADAEEALRKAKLTLVGLKDELGLAESAVNTGADDIIRAGKQLREFPLQDVAPLQAKLAGADAANNKHRQAAARKQLVTELESARTKAQALSDKIDQFDADKQNLMETAKFPVKGLSFTESGILFDGIPFEQAASSTKRRVSVAIGAALNPTLRVMVIKDGSLLGTKGVEQVRELAREFDLQVWIEVVTSDAEDRSRCTVVIEDGTVMGAPKVEDLPEPPEKSSTAEHVEPPKDLFNDLPAQ